MTGAAKCVLFDWDGTLIESRDALLASWFEATEAVLGRRYPDTDAERREVFSRRGSELFATLASSPAQAAELDSRFQQAYAGQSVLPFPGIADALAALQELDVHPVVVTSKARGRVESDLASAGLEKWITLTVCAEDVTQPKPHPEPVLAALRLAGVSAEQAVLIGDTFADAEAGVAAGVDVLGAGWGYGSAESLLAAGASRVLATPADVVSAVIAHFDLIEPDLPSAADPAPRTPKGQQTRQRILVAAGQLFAQRGYAAVRVADITAAADLSPGAFYRYFKDRHELLLVLLRALTDDAFDFARAPWDARRPMDSVSRTTELYFKYYQEHRGLFAVLVELGQSDPAVAEIWARSRTAFYSRIAHALARGVATGSVRADLDVEVAAEMLGSMTEFYAFQRYVLGGSSLKDVAPEEATAVLSSIWTAGMLLHGEGFDPKESDA